MAELIKYRNDAAHGSIDIGDILHSNVLLEFCEFVQAICEAIAERVQLAGLIYLKQYGHVKELGRINESLKKYLVGIGVMKGNFSKGATVYLCGDSYCLERNVVSLQLDDVDHENVELAVETELGIMFDAPGRKNSVVLMIDETVVIAQNAVPLDVAPGLARG